MKLTKIIKRLHESLDLSVLNTNVKSEKELIQAIRKNVLEYDMPCKSFARDLSSKEQKEIEKTTGKTPVSYGLITFCKKDFKHDLSNQKLRSPVTTFEVVNLWDEGEALLRKEMTIKDLLNTGTWRHFD